MSQTMTVLRQITIVFGLIVFANCQQQAEISAADLDTILNKVFPNPAEQSSSTSSSNQRTQSGFEKAPNLQPIEEASGSDSGGGEIGPDGCVCVDYFLCDNGTINTDGKHVIDIRNKDTTCSTYFHVCCGQEHRITNPVTPKGPPGPVVTPTTSSIDHHQTDDVDDRSGCGYRNPEGVGFRITGDDDNESQFGEFPWMVAIMREQLIEGNPSPISVYQCGGSLIHPQVVLTGAHCINLRHKYWARVGEWDTQTNRELYPYQDRAIVKSVIHPNYYSGALHNDIALLFLQSPVEYADNVNTICLPPQGVVVDYGRCYVSGWGKNVFGKKGKYQVIMKKIDLPMVGHDQCQAQLRRTRLGRYFELHESFVCAGGEEGHDACKGDGGGPLVCPIAGQYERYYQIGTVAWGIGCGQKNVPGVYGNVAHFRTWIDQQLQLNQLEGSAYTY